MVVSEVDAQPSYETSVFAPEVPDEAVYGGGGGFAGEDEGFVDKEVGEGFAAEGGADVEDGEGVGQRRGCLFPVGGALGVAVGVGWGGGGEGRVMAPGEEEEGGGEEVGVDYLAEFEGEG